MAETQLHGNKVHNRYAVLACDGEDQCESDDDDGFLESDGQGPATAPPQQQLDSWTLRQGVRASGVENLCHQPQLIDFPFLSTSLLH